MTFIETEYKWPKKGDRLLRAETDWHQAVTFEEHQITPRGLHLGRLYEGGRNADRSMAVIA